jgi:hypothetical protein
VHVHIGALEAVTFLLFLIIVGAGWRMAAGHLVQSDNPTAVVFGEAMASIY